MDVALLAGGLAAVTGAGVVAGSVLTSRRASLEAVEYVRSLDTSGTLAVGDFDEALGEPFLTRVLRPAATRIVGLVGALTPGNHRARVQDQLLHAGVSSRYRAEEIIAGQVALGLLGLCVGLVVVGFQLVSAGLGLTLLLVLPVVGLLLPGARLNRAVGARRSAVLADLPDTLDLLAISVEAGVGLEGAMGVVCERFHSPLAEEFSRTLKEMELGLARKDALHNLKRRTDVPELSAFVSALIQADALGMSIGRVLKLQAGEMRLKRRQWARERAAKLPVKIIFPLVMCIFPAVLVVVLAPAASQISQALR